MSPAPARPLYYYQVANGWQIVPALSGSGSKGFGSRPTAMRHRPMAGAAVRPASGAPGAHSSWNSGMEMLP
eukprot:9217-Prorocentrum_minimum.AAC.1